MAESRAILPVGQGWLIKRMQTLGYGVETSGICVGIAGCGILAVLVGGMPRFFKRLHIINSVPIEKFYKWVNQLHQQRVTLVVKTKTAALEKFHFLSEINRNKFINKKYIQDKFRSIEVLVKESVAVEEQQKITDYLKNSLLENCYTKPFLEELNSQLPEDCHITLEISHFFDLVEICQRLHCHTELFCDEQPTDQDLQRSFQIVLSQQLEKEGGIFQGDVFSGIYDLEALTEYFSSLEATIEATGYDQPVCLLLENSRHSIAVCFDAALETKWIFIDANYLEMADPMAEESTSAGQIAEWVLGSLSMNAVATFTITFFVKQSNKNKLIQLTYCWKNTEEWKKLHEVSVKNALLTDSSGISWLYFAAGSEDQIHIVKDLLAKGAQVNPDILANAIKKNCIGIVKLLLPYVDVNALNSKGFPPIILAVDRGYTDIVNVLLAEQANVNVVLKDGSTPLHLAADRRYIEIVKVLLAANANVEATLKDSSTPLHFAVDRQCLEIVTLLLAAKANANVVDDQGFTPLFCAARDGNLAIVEALLNGGAEMNWANNRGETAFSIAAQMGHTDVVRLLLDKNVTQPDNNEVRSFGL